jgi:hypothetical protein
MFRAYEISTYWREKPPPPEILENLTAKGGDLRNRTLENFHAPTSRDSGVMADGLESADDEQRTPKADPMDVDEPGSGGRYPTSELPPKITCQNIVELLWTKNLGSTLIRPASGQISRHQC